MPYKDPAKQKQYYKKYHKKIRQQKNISEQNRRNKIRLLKIKALRAKGKKLIEEPINRLLGGLPK